MKRLMIAVLTSAEIKQKQWHIATLVQRLSCDAVLCCVMDTASLTKRTLPEHWSVISAMDLFGTQYYNEAFSLEHEALRTRCALALLEQHLPNQEVVLVNTLVEIKQFQQGTWKQDTVCGTAQTLPDSVPFDAQNWEYPMLQRDILFFADGARMRKWLKWCNGKMRWLARADAPKIGVGNELNVQVQTKAFCNSYLDTARLFGCDVIALPAQEFSYTVLPSMHARIGDAFARFHDGTAIHPVLRPYYSRNYRLQQNCEHMPFAHPEVFFAQNAVAGDVHPVIFPPALEAIYDARDDLRFAYHWKTEAGRLGLVRWYVTYGASEFGIAEHWVQPVRDSLEQYETQCAQNDARNRSLQYRVQQKLLRYKKQPQDALYPFGVNLCGFIKGDFGLGESVRTVARSLVSAGIPFTVIDFQGAEMHTYTNTEFDSVITNNFEYSINLFAINGDAQNLFLQSVANTVCDGRYNIGYWAWELPEFPTGGWEAGFDTLDEVWTCSDFATASIAQKSPVPVWTLPCAIDVAYDTAGTRADFGLPNDQFIFLMMYDVRSFSARKNPQAAVEAFLKAFADRDDVCLLMKLNVPENWDGEDDLLDTLKQHSNIITYAKKLSKDALNTLIAQCDAMVSLHRSEGFGLCPAEAMYLGKPAVLTNWSGNTEYMREGACCPVEYRIIEIDQDYGPYKKGMHWADADTDCAAALMQRLVDDKQYYKAIATAGQQFVQTQLSVQAIGAQMYHRFETLKLIPQQIELEEH